MADPEHLAILEQGVEIWNEWRKEHLEIKPDLSGIIFRSISLHMPDLIGVDFRSAYLRGADFSRFYEEAGIYHGPIFNNADFSDAILDNTHFENSNMSGANFEKASIKDAIIWRSGFTDANFYGASIEWSHFRRNYLQGANFSEVHLWNTIFTDEDLSKVVGLNTAIHGGPSTVGIDTIVNSHGNIHEAFLRGVGVPDSIIEAIPSLIGSLNPIVFYSCFISYSSKEQDFADRLYADLQKKGVRCWFAPHDMRIGDKIRPRIDESICLYDKLLLILSEHSVASQWVEHEVETALGKELEGKPSVLFPIRLDESVMQSRTGWASHIRLTRHIGDFTNWKNHDEYQKAFNRLLRDLKAEA